MRVIGLCGGSGSGKSTVASMFSAYGIPSVNADAVYHDIVSQDGACLCELRRAFGEQIVKDGALDRKTMASIVFADGAEDKRHLLESITHRYVLQKIRDILADYDRQGARAALVDAPLLFESGFDKECAACLCVIADTDVRVRRLVARDGITAEEAQRRIGAQISNRELLARCSFSLDNSTDLEKTRTQVAKLAKIFLSDTFETLK